jgi:hypothetical protein
MCFLARTLFQPTVRLILSYTSVLSAEIEMSPVNRFPAPRYRTVKGQIVVTDVRMSLSWQSCRAKAFGMYCIPAAVQHDKFLTLDFSPETYMLTYYVL